ncbi:hypothetical protein FS749_005532 [Ceratobasidium sp. UAMH 11750]|nr:hypothetical protein FS749_005532 [Ceratobasidium sp. UAMH 11750]
MPAPTPCPRSLTARPLVFCAHPPALANLRPTHTRPPTFVRQRPRSRPPTTTLVGPLPPIVQVRPHANARLKCADVHTRPRLNAPRPAHPRPHSPLPICARRRSTLSFANALVDHLVVVAAEVSLRTPDYVTPAHRSSLRVCSRWRSPTPAPTLARSRLHAHTLAFALTPPARSRLATLAGPHSLPQ